MKPDIYQIEMIGSGVLAVMAKPVSGEWIEEEFLGIANEGIQHIVSLLEMHEAYEVGLQREKELSEINGMKYTSYQMQDRSVPKSVDIFSDFTKKLHHEIAGGENTVIHCRAGIGRTGLVAAGILLHCGFTPEAAFEHVSEKKGVKVPDTEEQENWLKSYSNEITKHL